MQFIMDNGHLMDNAKVEELKYGKMEANILGIGLTILQMEEAASSILMATFTKASGITTKRKARGFMNIWMERSTLAIGYKICNMGTESKPGQMMPSMREITTTVKNMELEASSGKMGLRIQESFIIITFMAKESTLGPTVETTKEHGKQIKCMAMVYLLGKMAANTSVNISKTKRKDTENLHGQMGDVIEESGQKENSMEKDIISLLLAQKNTVNGRKARRSDG